MIRTISKAIAETFINFVINDIYKNYEILKKIITDKNINL